MRDLLVLFLLLTGDRSLSAAEDVDPCLADKHSLLSGEEWRSAGVSTGGEARCDRRLTAGWYRVDSKAGNDMPRKCPDENTCGTLFPIWMKDELPLNDGKIHLKAAYVHFEGDCLFDQVNIRVKNCGEYRVYELKPLKFCPSVYCFGDKKPCNKDESSETGYSPCSTDFPKQEHSPKFDWEVGRRSRDATKPFKPGSVFTCKLPVVPAGNVILDVEWYSRAPGFTRQRLYPPAGQKQIVNANETPMLFEDDIYSAGDAFKEKPTPIGKYFSCSIRARFGEGKTPSPYAYSNEYFVGLKILTPKLSIIEGNSKEIEAQPTIPVFNKGTTQTVIAFGLVLPSYQRSLESCENLSADDNQMLVLDNTNCALRVPGITYNANTWSTDYAAYKNKKFKIPVRVKIDNKYGSKVMSVKFKITEAYLTHPIWSYYTLPDVQITVTDEDIQLQGKLCESRNDPHMKTFDGRKYEHHIEGEFVLYRHKTIPVQVNTYYKRCNGKATCNCAVAVKSGKDVFIIDKCLRNEGIVKQYNTRNPMRVGVIGCDRKGMTVMRKGDYYYYVTLPTGTLVIIHLTGDYINVDIRPSVLDIKQTEGLCGTLNNDHTDDFNLLDLKWRVDNPGPKSLYNGVKDHETYSWHTYCSCIPGNTATDPGTVNCKYDAVADKCIEKGKIISRKHYQKCASRRRKSTRYLSRDRRDVSQEEPEYVFEYDKDFVGAPPEWKNDWTEAKAKHFCENYIRSSAAGKICSERVQNVDIDGPIDNCVKDIHLSGNTTWKATALQGLIIQCESEIERNTSLWTKDAKTGYMTKPSDIMDKLCPDNCSGNGICEQGDCKCSTGYGGPDCARPLSSPPVDVYLTPREAACQKDKDECDMVPVNGENFVESEKLSCKLRRCGIGPTGIQQCTALRANTAEYEHIEKVNCHLPTSRKRRSSEKDKTFAEVYYASVSNDGVTFSAEVAMVVYDSRCYECNATALICQLKNNTCLIEDACYSAGQTHPSKSCLLCNPDAGLTQWTTAASKCHISGACYENGAVNPTDQCKTCDVSGSTTLWTNRTVPSCLPTTTTTSTPTSTTTTTSTSINPTTSTTPSTTLTTTSTTTTPTTPTSTTLSPTSVPTKTSSSTTTTSTTTSSTSPTTSATTFTFSTTTTPATSTKITPTPTSTSTVHSVSETVSTRTTPPPTSAFSSVTTVARPSSSTTSSIITSPTTAKPSEITPTSPKISSTSEALTTASSSTISSIISKAISTVRSTRHQATTMQTSGRQAITSTKVFSTQSAISRKAMPSSTTKVPTLQKPNGRNKKEWVYPVIAGALLIVLITIVSLAVICKKTQKIGRPPVQRHEAYRTANGRRLSRQSVVTPLSVDPMWFEGDEPQQWQQSAPPSISM